jgi:hypothetical protein
MAGDWIKVEKSTPRKPEVLRLAVLLNIHPDHAFGLCCRFWSWCDDNLTNSNAQGVTESLLDALLGRDGFASALVQVGWLQVRQGSLVIPNFDLHLSQGAKSRALAARRQAQHRSRKSNAESVTKTSPEKRREENTSIGTGEPPVHAKDENPFYEPKDVPEQINPIARYSQLVQEKSRRILSGWHFWRFGSLPNLANESTNNNLNTIAATVEAFGDGVEEKMTQFMAQPPPGFPRTSPLFRIFKHLGLEAPTDDPTRTHQRTDNQATRRPAHHRSGPPMAAGGGRPESIKPRIAVD